MHAGARILVDICYKPRMLPLVAILGRPNVGKSTLFNRLVGRKIAIVDDTPGVTRDRKEAEANIGGRSVRLVDTAGLEEADPDTIPGFADGDWPALITSTMLREVPEPVLKAFGDRGPSALNGDLVAFNADDVPAIKAMLAELGYTVVERPDLRLDPEG